VDLLFDIPGDLIDNPGDLKDTPGDLTDIDGDLLVDIFGELEFAIPRDFAFPLG